MTAVSSRRDFLVYSGAAIAGVTLGETGRRWLARADARADAWRERGVETWATTICRECPAGCGASVRLVDDVPVKIEGNPLCPIARGRLCARGQAAIESYFDPDRFVGPAHRVSRSGAPRWEPLPWKDAIVLAADHLRRAAGTPDGIVVVAADDRGPIADAWTSVWRGAGARVAWTPLPTAARLRSNLARLTGADGDPIFDLERASYILSFGAPIADDWLSGVWTQRSFGRFRRRPGASRGRLVQIEGRRSPTVRKADEWLAVPSDRQAVLAYGIASVLLRENRINRDRLEPFAGNLATFEHQVVTYYTPDNVSSQTGVPVVTILRLARELMATPQPLVVVDANAGATLVDAVFALNALIGAVDRPGGLFAKADDPAPVRDDAITTLRGIDEGRIRPSVLVFADSSALRALGALNHPETLSARVPFIINLSPFVDEASMIADLILPTDVALESWHATIPPSALRVDVVAATRPAVKRRLDTQDIGSVLKSLAAGIGGAANDACTWTSSEDLVRTDLKRLARLRRGTPYVTVYETDWMRQLESGGWWARAADSDEEFIERVLAAGGWVDPFVDSTQLTDALRNGRGLTFPLPEVLPAATTAMQAAMRSEDAKPADPRFSVQLVAFHPSVSNLAGNPNLPVLFELLGQPDSVPWAIWVEIGTELADRLGVPQRARVRIRSAHDSLEAIAVRVPGMPTDMAAVSFVPGGHTNGRWARLVGKDPRRLWGDGSTANSCAVDLVRI